MSALILRAGWRQLTRYRGQWALSVLAIALGVAVVVAVDLANQSALRAFDAAHEVLSGPVTHQVVGGPEGVPEEVYRWLRVEAGVRRAAPVVEGRALLPALDQAVSLLGLDPFAEGEFRGFAAAGGTGESDAGALIARRDTALLPPPLAQDLALTPGETFRLQLGGREAGLSFIGRLAVDEPALAELVVVDIATAQELLGQLGRLSRIDLILDSEQAAALAERLPPGLQLLAAAEGENSLAELTRAFRLNLTALSLLALLVGLFLIYNTMSFAVVRRRPIIGSLRALGVTRREILQNLLLEAALLGLLGSILGIALGVPLAEGLVRLVGRTVESLYYEQAVLGLVLAPLSLVKALLLGVLGALFAAYLPAREAAALPPRAVLSRASLELGSRRWLLRAVLLGLVLLIVGALILLFGRSLIGGFAGLFAVVLGLALWVPAVAAVLLGLVGAGLARLGGISARLAARGAVASLSRTGVAVTALAVAVSAVIGVGLMIESFRGSVIGWLEHTLRADFYLSAEAGGGRSPLTEEMLSEIRDTAGVAELSLSRRPQLATTQGSVQLWALEMGPRGWAGFDFLAGDPARAWAGFEAGGVLVSEPFAYRRDLAVGDALSLPTRQGSRQFPVVGIYRDYGSDRGVVTLHADTLQRWFGDSPIVGVGVYAETGADPAPLEAALRRELAAEPAIRVRSQQALKVRSVEIFDQTFAITNVLRLLAGAVAFAGVLAALAALQLERARESAVLRAVGFTPGQLAGLTISQSGLLGVMAGLCAIPIGLALSGLLVHVILRRAFGWSMNFVVPPSTLLEGLALATVAALLAALYPAWRGMRAAPAQALREEA